MNENLLLLKDSLGPFNNKIYKCKKKKNVYIDKLDYIVNNYNNTYHSTVKMKPVNIKSNTYIDSSKEINNKDPKYKIGDVRISKLKNVFTKSYFQNWSMDICY